MIYQRPQKDSFDVLEQGRVSRGAAFEAQTSQLVGLPIPQIDGKRPNAESSTTGGRFEFTKRSFPLLPAARPARVTPRRLAKLTGYRVHLNRGLMSGASGGVTSGERSCFSRHFTEKNKCESRAEQEPTDNAELIGVASNSPSAS